MPSVPDLTTHLGPLTLANPVMPASGCFGPELGQVIGLSELGALVTKTVFSAVRAGNDPHRITDTSTGVLNSVGIPSPGVERFTESTLIAYREPGVPVIVSVGGLAVHEYWDITTQLADEQVEALEVNVSCPNLEHGGLTIGTDPDQVYDVVRGMVDRAGDIPVIVKLTPNVTSIAELAQASESAGAVAVTVANTFVGLAIDIDLRRPVLGHVTGGVSGPLIKPLALRLVWEAAQAVTIPVIGCGGISSTSDAMEFLLAGATAVQIGTATFARPSTMATIVCELPGLLDAQGFDRVEDAVGALAS